MTPWDERATLLMNRAGALVTLLSALMIASDVVSRNAWGVPFASVPEVASIALVFIVFMQLPHAMRSDKLLRVTFVLDRVPLSGRRGLDALAYLLAAVLFAILSITSWHPLLESIATREFYGADAFQIRAWPLRVATLLLWFVASALALWLALKALRANGHVVPQAE